MVNEWGNLNAARAALADPAASPELLRAICLAQPGLGAEVALHPAIDGPLLGWLARSDDPITAATAQSRLAAAPSERLRATADQNESALPNGTVPTSAEPAPSHHQARRTGSRRMLITAAIAAAAVLVVVVVGVALVLPWLSGRGGVYSYAPDLREQPGLLAVNAQAGLPNGDDQSWTTTFTAVPGTGITLAYNSTSAFSDYRQKLTEYTEAAAAYREWETNYAAGYAEGKACLTRTSEIGSYPSMRDYCSNGSGSFTTPASTGGQAGFYDAIEGLPATPAQPGSDSGYDDPPEVPVKPIPPKVGDTIVGIEMATGKAVWTLDLGTVWSGVQPAAWQSNTDAGRTLLVLSDPTSEENDSQRLLALVNDKTGAVTLGKPMDGADLGRAELYGDVVVVGDEDGNLRAVNASDLVTEKWTTSARAVERSEEGNFYGVGAIPGYLLTADGYIRLSDGTPAEFARDAGQDGIELVVLNGTQSDLLRVEARDGAYDVSGFNSGNNTETWHLDNVSAIPTKAGGLLLATTGDEVAAYRINGSELERKWSTSCSDYCTISFADDSRVFVEDSGEKKSTILKTADGTKIDQVRDDEGQGLVVGRSVAYLHTQDRLIAYDLDRAGIPTLWRSRNVEGWLTTFEGSLVLVDNGKGVLGIIGLKADDWDAFTPSE